MVWHFVSLPARESRQIKNIFGGARPWGSVPVTVTVGMTTWTTSIFPDSVSGAYLLPLRLDVRKKEGIREGSVIAFSIRCA